MARTPPSPWGLPPPEVASEVLGAGGLDLLRPAQLRFLGPNCRLRAWVEPEEGAGLSSKNILQSKDAQVGDGADEEQATMDLQRRWSLRVARAVLLAFGAEVLAERDAPGVTLWVSASDSAATPPPGVDCRDPAFVFDLLHARLEAWETEA